MFVATPAVVASLHVHTECGWCIPGDVYADGRVRVRRLRLSEGCVTQI